MDQIRAVPENKDAWQRFMDLYSPIIARWLRGNGILNNADINDLTQEIVFKVYRQLMAGFEYDPKESFRAWLFTMTRRLAITWLDRNDRRDLVELIDTVDPVADVFASDVFYKVLFAEALQLISGEFNEVHIEAFNQCATYGLTQKEAAEKLGITENVVRNAVFRIRKKLQQLLKGMVE